MSHSALRCAVLVGVSVIGVSTTIDAAPADTTDEHNRVVEPSQGVEWRTEWGRVRPWEYAATVGLMTEAFLVRFVGPDPPHDRSTVGIDVDIIDAIGLEGSDRDAVKLASDIGYFGSMAYRLVDSTLLPIVVWGAPDVALQMSFIDLESFAIVAGVLWNAQLLVGRERPTYRDCPESSVDDLSCATQSDNRWRSFIAGHLAVATTAAGLTCLHHAHLPLYGGGFGDDLACASTIGVAIVVGSGRALSQEHYPSDIVLGAGLGAVAGYIIPSALHYGFGDGNESNVSEKSSSGPNGAFARVSLLPVVDESMLGGALIGIF